MLSDVSWLVWHRRSSERVCRLFQISGASQALLALRQRLRRPELTMAYNISRMPGIVPEIGVRYLSMETGRLYDVWTPAFSTFDRNTASQRVKPTIVLLHEAFHTPAHFEELIRELRVADYRVLAPQLPSSSSTEQASVFELDVQTIYSATKPELDGGRNVIFVLHGYSGLPGSVAAERLNQYALNRPRAGFVMKLVFFAAVVAKANECYLDVVRPEWIVHENGNLGVRKPGETFYQDCLVNQIRSAVGLLRTQRRESFRTRVASPGWTQIPCLYVVCEADNAILPSWQHACLRTLQTTNRQVTALRLNAGHSPFLSSTRDTARLIVGAAGGS